MVIDSFRGDYAFLSNYYLREIDYKGKLWPSTEHAYQAEKFVDENVRDLIQAAVTPNESKKLGRSPGMRADWDDIKLEVMEAILRVKFAHQDLAARLKATGDATLIEGNRWGDTYWGICKGVGENHLGELLMKLRAVL